MTVVEWLTAVSLLIGISSVAIKIFFINPLKAFIKEQTYPIQPTANGGRSLPDVAASVRRIEDRLNEHIDFHLKDK
jgi:hypothetical protein